jgi:hypothetical protein
MEWAPCMMYVLYLFVLGCAFVSPTFQCRPRCCSASAAQASSTCGQGSCWHEGKVNKPPACCWHCAQVLGLRAAYEDVTLRLPAAGSPAAIYGRVESFVQLEASLQSGPEAAGPGSVWPMVESWRLEELSYMVVSAVRWGPADADAGVLTTEHSIRVRILSAGMLCLARLCCCAGALLGPVVWLQRTAKHIQLPL